MQSEYICPDCGKSHAGLPTDWGYKLPDEAWAIPEPEREKQVKSTSDLCEFKDRFFIRGLLPVPFNTGEGYFGWGIWAEVSRPVFQRYLSIYKVDASAEPEVEGSIANEIPGYGKVLGEKIRIRFGTSSQRPTFYLLAESHLQIAQEQRQGIGSFRYHEILGQVGYEP